MSRPVQTAYSGLLRGKVVQAIYSEPSEETGNGKTTDQSVYDLRIAFTDGTTLRLTERMCAGAIDVEIHYPTNSTRKEPT